MAMGLVAAVGMLAGRPAAAQGGGALREGPVIVRYDAGDEALARRTLDVAAGFVEEMAPHLPPGDAPIAITLAGTHERFRGLAGRHGHTSVMGLARSRQGEIVVKAPELYIRGGDFAGVVRHELMHVLLARNIEPDNMPRWLNEGVSMLVSREKRLNNIATIGWMALRGQVVPYEQLDLAFRIESPEGMGRVYAQSRSMAAHLRDTLGEEAFWEFLHSLDERPFREAFEDAVGKAPAEWYADWRDSLWEFALIASLVSGFGVFQMGALLLIVAYVLRRRRARRVLARWDAEEQAVSTR
jgi:hypothetical protein